MSSKRIVEGHKDSAVSEIIGYILVFSLAVVLIGTSILIYVPDSGTANDLNYQATALSSVENLQTSLINSGALTGTQYYENIPMGIQSSFFGQNTPTSVSYLSNSNFSYSYSLKLGVQVEGYNANNKYNKVVGSISIPDGSYPDSVAFDSSNGNLYVTTYYGGDLGGGTVTVISSSTDKVIQTISLKHNPYAIAVDSFSNTLIVSMNDNGIGAFESISIATCQELACHVSASNSLYYDIAYDSTTGNLLVGLESTSEVSGLAVYNASTFIHIKTITVRQDPNVIPSAIVYDSANGLIYVAGGIYDWALNGVTYNVANLYPVPGPYGFTPCQDASPWGIAFDTYTGNIYASAQTVSGSGLDALIPAGSGYCHVYQFSGTTASCLSKIKTYSEPVSLVYDPANREIYVADFNKGVVAVLNGMDTSETTPIQYIDVGSGPGAGFNSLAYDSANGNIYVLNLYSDNISVIQGNTQLGKGWKISDGGLPLSYGFNGSGSIAVTGPTNFVKQYTYSLEDGSVLQTGTNGNGRNESALPFIFNLTSGYLGFTTNLVNFAGSGNIQMDTDNPTSVTLTLLNSSGMTLTSGEIVTLVNTTNGDTLTVKILNIYLDDFTYSFTSPLYKAWDYSFYNTYVAAGASYGYVNSLSTYDFTAPTMTATVSGDTVTFHSSSEIILYAITLGYYDYGVQITSS